MDILQYIPVSAHTCIHIHVYACACTCVHVYVAMTISKDQIGNIFSVCRYSLI